MVEGKPKETKEVEWVDNWKIEPKKSEELIDDTYRDSRDFKNSICDSSSENNDFETDGQFISNLSHRVKNPFGQELLTHDDIKEKQKSLVQKNEQ